MDTYPVAQRHSSFWQVLFRVLLALILTVSLAFNLIFIVALAGLRYVASGSEVDGSLREKVESGPRHAAHKIAVVRVEGIILEGLTGFATKQIEAAAEDPAVKAVVVRINSPGGSITASDDLYRRLCLLRDGDPERQTPAKPLVVSMASLAASGGYYIAMPAKHLVAERTSITGSIGVYAAFPNVSELAQKWGVKMEVIKRGDVKTSGSMFHDMTPQERQLWQDLIDHAYDQFLDVVRKGRGNKLTCGLTESIPDETKVIGGDRG